jgi:ABC-type proline/glycine betaine transport system ATPase subunit
MLKGKTRILATHAIDFLHLADKVIVLDAGNIATQGSFEEVQKHPIVKNIMAIHNKNEAENKEAFKEKDERHIHDEGCESSNSDTDEEHLGMTKMVSKSLNLT